MLTMNKIRWWAVALRIVILGPPYVFFCIGQYAGKLCDWLECRLPMPVKRKTPRTDWTGHDVS